MFNNLIIELQKSKIKIKDAACALKISKNMFIQKLKGVKDFNLKECLKLQKIIADGHISLEYLFKKTGFSLIELLVSLIIMSLILIAFAPVLTKKHKNELQLLNKHSYFKTKEILFGDENCSNVDESLGICTGTVTLSDVSAPFGFVTVLGGGGGGGSGITQGSAEYKTQGTYQFKVPYGVDEIEVTLVSGGAGGFAGELGDIKAYSWSHSGTINRTYVSADYIPIVNLTSRGVSTTNAYNDAIATLSVNDLMYVYTNTIRAIVQAGGGSGGRGYLGTGGGGGGYNNALITLDNTLNYTVGIGGGAYAPSSAIGLAGGASYIKDSSGYKIVATGGGGGAWGTNMRSGNDAQTIDGIMGGAGGQINFTTCAYYPQNDSGSVWTQIPSGGKGGKPYGGGNADDAYCVDNSSINIYGISRSVLFYYTRGSNGGNSVFGLGGVNVCNQNNSNRHAKGYGSGGAGANGPAPYCGEPEYQGSGAPGFAGLVYREIAHGGASGGAGSIVPKQRIKVTPNEILTVVVGAGGTGGKIVVSGSNLTINRTDPTSGAPSYIKRGSTLLKSSSVAGDCDFGGCIGSINGERGKKGIIHNGVNSFSTYSISKINDLPVSKWNITQGGYPGGASSLVTFTKEHNGAQGAYTIIDGEKLCSQGIGATVYDGSRVNATGSGGCSGAGGYGNHFGGDGADGYVKITWNPDGKGFGGGGSAGVAVRKKIKFNLGKTYSIQIGKGGVGAKFLDGVFVDATNGSATIFGTGADEAGLSACGGAAGGNGGYNGSVYNGAGGVVTGSCLTVAGDIFNGVKGYDAILGLTGKGASSSYGPGGKAVKTGNGYDGSGHGAGGSGAGGCLLNQTCIGGDGMEGKILIEWQ